MSAKDLEKLFDRLVRVSIVILGSSSFLLYLRHAFYSARNGISNLNTNYMDDLKLWIEIIKKSIEGTPISKLVLLLPNKMHFTDSSGKALVRHHFQTRRT